MAEVTNELIYEVLKRIQIDISALREGQIELRTEMAATNGLMFMKKSNSENVPACKVREL
jgi:hypothetical protein